MHMSTHLAILRKKNIISILIYYNYFILFFYILLPTLAENSKNHKHIHCWYLSALICKFSVIKESSVPLGYCPSQHQQNALH